jgi:hypothetical protein
MVVVVLVLMMGIYMLFVISVRYMVKYLDMFEFFPSYVGYPTLPFEKGNITYLIGNSTFLACFNGNVSLFGR